MMNRTARLALTASLAFSVVAAAGNPPDGINTNQVPNALLLGSAGSSVASSGTVPTLWRAFAVGGGAVTITPVPLASGAVFQGSPALNAARICTTAFGADQGFDHNQALFSVLPGLRYRASFYVRSGNPGAANQSFTMSFPLYAANGEFNGRQPGSLQASAGAAWTRIDAPAFRAQGGDAYGQLAFRLLDDGGQNCIELALPTVNGPPLVNETPNPGFVGSGGASTPVQVSGTIPDHWRAFAVGSGSLNLSVVPVAAGELFPGSAATQAVRLQVSGGDGASEGFDHELVRSLLLAGHRYHGQVWMRSGNSGGASQGVTVSLPVFDADGVFTGNQSGSFVATVGATWSLYAGPQFEAPSGHSSNLAFRLTSDGGQDILLIAAPALVGPTLDLVFRSGFELP